MSVDQLVDKLFVELEGYLLVPEVRQTLTAIVGFYFGNASAAAKT